jgi:tripartite-type tricarboxylate transporter receptor subunit TctC
LGVVANGALAQGGYPNKPIRFVVPYAPGGTVDLLGRILAESLTKILGQNVIVDNRVGAGGQLGTTFVAKQVTPDGYTIVVNSSAPLATGVTLYPNMPYDVEKDLAPVTVIAENAIVFVAHPSFPAQSLEDVVKVANARAEGIKLGIPSSGSMHHLVAEQFKLLTGARATLVPYKGEAQPVADTVAGHLDVTVLNLPSTMQHIKGGRMRPLAITGPKRSAQVPDVPTVREIGLAPLECIAWFAVMAPAATPKDVLVKLNQAFGQSLQSAEVKQKFDAVGATPIHMSQEETGAFIKREIARWAKVVKDSGAKFQ